MPPVSPARAAAFAVLLQVERERAWASNALRARTQALEARDAALAHEIVLGALRRQSQLDFRIDRLVDSRLDIEIRIALRMGAYQILHLDRVPVRAAVHESVELVKHARKRSAAGLVNAVLRRIESTDIEGSGRATQLATPEWLLARWDAEFGPEAADRIAAASLIPPERYVRGPVPGLTLEPAGVTGAWRVTAGDTRGVRLQDIGSQTIVPMLRIERGQRFLDVCAAPGNKTMQAIDAGARVIACDRHLHRLRDVACRDRVLLDAGAGLPFRGGFDRILVDAPCSGTGTLGRNPEIKWQLRPDDLDILHEKQTAILKHSLRLLAPGGRLVYSTCSLERIENEDVVARAAAGYRNAEEVHRIPGRDEGDGFYAVVLEAT